MTKSGEKSNYILNMAQEGTLTAEQLKDMEVEVYYVLENFIDRYYREHLQIAPTIIVAHFVQLLQLLDGTLPSSHFLQRIEDQIRLPFIFSVQDSMSRY